MDAKVGLPSGNKAVVEGAITGFGEAYIGWKTLGDAFQHSGIRERENRSKTVYGECELGKANGDATLRGTSAGVRPSSVVISTGKVIRSPA